MRSARTVPVLMESPDLLEMLYYSVFDGEAHGDVIELDR